MKGFRMEANIFAVALFIVNKIKTITYFA